MNELNGAFKAKEVKQEEDKPQETLRQKRLYEVLAIWESLYVGDEAWADARQLASATNDLNLKCGFYAPKEPIENLLDSEKYKINYFKSEDVAHNRHDPCSALRADIEAINRNPKFERIILCKGNKYKIASSREEAYFAINRIDKKLAYYGSLKSIIMDKMNRNGQGKTVDNDDNPMSEASEQTHKTYGK